MNKKKFWKNEDQNSIKKKTIEIKCWEVKLKKKYKKG
jgi:hypothetical protein